jgi:L-alanine-DL-glutamate epimerase-like enolase superfamily enzyme
MAPAGSSTPWASPNLDPVLEVSIHDQSFPIAGGFTISRGTKLAAHVLVVELRDGDSLGRGECVPYSRYGETMVTVRQQLDRVTAHLREGVTRAELAEILPAGAARNAVDCALWDLQAKRDGTTVHDLAGCSLPAPVTTAFTLSLDGPVAMGEAARRQATRPLLKLKLAGDDDDVARVAAVRAGAPGARLIVDANEGGTPATVQTLTLRLAELDVALIEQPLPAGEDELLADIDHIVPFCADESCHTAADVEHLRQRYDAVNIKLDKTGGLTEALRLHRSAREADLQIMVGCMVGTSLAMAPALLIAQDAEFVDLDGPLLLARDREPGLRFVGSLMYPAPAQLWG